MQEWYGGVMLGNAHYKIRHDNENIIPHASPNSQQGESHDHPTMIEEKTCLYPTLGGF